MGQKCNSRCGETAVAQVVEYMCWRKCGEQLGEHFHIF